jgi:hypothetical protein
LVSTAVSTQAGIFLKSTVAVMAASMRALRLFERSIARRSAAASASERGRSPREEDFSDANVEVRLLTMMEHQATTAAAGALRYLCNLFWQMTTLQGVVIVSIQPPVGERGSSASLIRFRRPAKAPS